MDNEQPRKLQKNQSNVNNGTQNLWIIRDNTQGRLQQNNYGGTMKVNQ
jgi:hypothetical protein